MATDPADDMMVRLTCAGWDPALVVDPALPERGRRFPQDERAGAEYASASGSGAAQAESPGHTGNHIVDARQRKEEVLENSETGANCLRSAANKSTSLAMHAHADSMSTSISTSPVLSLCSPSKSPGTRHSNPFIEFSRGPGAIEDNKPTSRPTQPAQPAQPAQAQQPARPTQATRVANWEGAADSTTPAAGPHPRRVKLGPKQQRDKLASIRRKLETAMQELEALEEELRIDAEERTPQELRREYAAVLQREYAATMAHAPPVARARGSPAVVPVRASGYGYGTVSALVRPPPGMASRAPGFAWAPSYPSDPGPSQVPAFTQGWVPEPVRHYASTSPPPPTDTWRSATLAFGGLSMSSGSTDRSSIAIRDPPSGLAAPQQQQQGQSGMSSTESTPARDAI